jgi:hypothetical protein
MKTVFIHRGQLTTVHATNEEHPASLLHDLDAWPAFNGLRIGTT